MCRMNSWPLYYLKYNKFNIYRFDASRYNQTSLRAKSMRILQF